MEMNQVLLLAAHLRRWGKADIICQIVPSTVVRVCASAPIGPPHGNPLAARFNDTFPDQPNYHKVCSLYGECLFIGIDADTWCTSLCTQMLHLLSQGQPLQRLLPATMVAQRTFLEAVVSGPGGFLCFLFTSLWIKCTAISQLFAYV